jgi:dihydrofolate synthase/folylpolyglutamate synthase
MLADKDIAGVVERVKGRIDHWLTASLPGPRGMGGEALAGILATHGIRADACFGSPADAYRAAKDRAGENDRIIAFGSFLTVAGVLYAIDDERKRRTT